jgi:hypothetical protein
VELAAGQTVRDLRACLGPARFRLIDSSDARVLQDDETLAGLTDVTAVRDIDPHEFAKTVLENSMEAFHVHGLGEDLILEKAPGSRGEGPAPSLYYLRSIANNLVLGEVGQLHAQQRLLYFTCFPANWRTENVEMQHRLGRFVVMLQDLEVQLKLDRIDWIL